MTEFPAPDPVPAPPANPESLGASDRTLVLTPKGRKIHAVAGDLGRGDRTFCGRRFPLLVAPARSYENKDWCRACARAVGGA